MSQLPKWNEMPPGGIVIEPGNSVNRLTGDWRILRPVINQDKCIRCMICWVYCPDSVIHVIDKPYTTSKGRRYDVTLEIDYGHCKGCGICVEECPVDAIDFVEEVGSDGQ